MVDRVILVGIGGATCSGKTTLAKHLKNILPDSVIVHQDDFAPPQELVPIHPVYQVQDWDKAEGAIQWQRMITFLHQVKKTGKIPPEHHSHDHLNEQKDIPIDEQTREKWHKYFGADKRRRASEGRPRIIWGLVDGFLLYWHPEVRDQLDPRFFLRVPEAVLRQRRHERHGYHTAVQTDPEGSLWRDPPNYWEQVVWPAYVEANKYLFVDGDVEGDIDFQGIELVDGLKKTMTEAVDRCCESLERLLDDQ